MADEKIILAGKISINAGEAEKSVKSAQSELKNLKKQLATMSEGDDGFDELTKKAAKLQDKISDVNARVKALASDTRSFDAIVGGVETAVGAFTAAQGAVALFAGENENLNKIIVKVQGSMALLNGIQALAKNLNKDSAMMVGLHNAAQRLFGVTLTTNIGILKLFTAALIGTGIGALAVVVGAVITQWDKLNERFKDSIPFLSKIGEAMENLPEIWAGVSNAIIEGIISIGRMAKMLWKRDWEGLANEAKNFGKKAAENYHKGYEEKSNELRLKNLNDDIERDYREWLKAEEEKNRLKMAALAKMDKEALDFRRAQLKKLQEGAGSLEDLTKPRIEKEVNAEKELTDKLIKEFQTRQEGQRLMSNARKRMAQEDVDLERATTDAKLAIAANGFALIHQLYMAFGAESTAAAKAFALAAIAADTARAIVGAIASAKDMPFPANLVAMSISVAAVTSAIAQATRILSSDVPMPNIAANMPTTSMGVPATFGAFNLQGSAPNISPITPSSTAPQSQRVYVLEDDIRSTTNRVNKNNQRGYVR